MATPPEFRAGFIAVIGRPNVGKSTLINALLAQKVAAVSPRPQTTRRQQLGILTTDSAQYIFVDTPGIHQPLHGLGERMNQEAIQALGDCDVALLVVDGSAPPSDEDRLIAENLAGFGPARPQTLALNKSDRVAGGASFAEPFKALFPAAEPIAISALTGDGLPALLEHLAGRLPVHEPFYPEDQITDFYERDIAADLIRETALNLLRDEVPHSLAIRIDEFTERGETGAYIAATLFVERESQVGIVVGAKGEMIKRIGVAARASIESMSGRKVHLELRVKLRKNWRNDPKTLDAFDFKNRGRR